ncbi:MULTISPECIES: ABC transporter ATP-binding protein [Burkholderia]|uniref:Spermidine/putrescine import ATP-binding protein PotA n=1 Tax=Burkholderia aenigmatica TaxID=2015348 RepID=A0A6J5IPM0_9BURK|nr:MULTISPECIES: ABC transporter ATP-binding protein [Burkholderia]CAB3961617.1 spermidine/putrescine ABC transporter ATPase [Burkholderia aenigmatica]
MASQVSIRNVCKTYENFTALRDVSLDISAGEFVTLLGPSGSGKTTLLMVLAGFVRATSGSVKAGGDELLLKPPHRRGIGMVFQNYALFPHMTVAQNVAYPLRLRKMDRARIAEKVRHALSVVRLDDLGGRNIAHLSGGQRQRVALARAIVFEPDIMLMDEPLSALDKQLREHMQIEIRRLHEQLGMTTIYVTHDQTEALTMSDRIAIINKGQLVQFDTPDTIYERPASKFVADFIGETAFVPLDEQRGEFSAFGQPFRTRGPIPDGVGRPWLALRPDRAILLDAPAPELNCLPGIVRQRIYQGDSHLFYVDLPHGHEIMIRRGTGGADGGARRLEPGDRITVGVRAEDTVVVRD